MEQRSQHSVLSAQSNNLHPSDNIHLGYVRESGYCSCELAIRSKPIRSRRSGGGGWWWWELC